MVIKLYEAIEWRIGRMACALGRCNVTCRGREACGRKLAARKRK
jgi:hypothetical protein